MFLVTKVLPDSPIYSISISTNFGSKNQHNIISIIIDDRSSIIIEVYDIIMDNISLYHNFGIL